ncbi:MAG: hypothetical protein ACFFCY_12050 [Promethearchaeota archaeon]
MDRLKNEQYTVILSYLIFSITFTISWFFPYYERCWTGWGIPCDSWLSITGFSFMISNFKSSCGIIGVNLIIFSMLLIYMSKVRFALILITLGNILIGISMHYLSYITKQGVIPGLYDVYFLFRIKISYRVGLFSWAIMSGINLFQIVVELERIFSSSLNLKAGELYKKV